jgi:AraC-like DNA-binding protein
MMMFAIIFREELHMEIKRLEKILQDFYQISGMEIVVGDSKYHSVAACRHQCENYCSLLHCSPDCLEMCKKSDLEQLTEAESTCRTALYECPFGVKEAIIPLVRGDSFAGYIICSMGTGEDGIPAARIENIVSEHPELSKDEIAHAAQEFPRISNAQRDAYLGMLEILARHIEAENLLPDDAQSIGCLVKNYVKNNLARKITLSDISWNLHCSTVTLTEHFKAEFGLTIMEYVMQKRMQRAERFLSETQKTIRDIAELCGFSDVEYFSRCFKKHRGSSPVMWRKQNKKL